MTIKIVKTNRAGPFKLLGKMESVGRIMDLGEAIYIKTIYFGFLKCKNKHRKQIGCCCRIRNPPLTM